MIELDILIFDMDGTLVDSKDVILGGINHVLQKASRGPMAFGQVLPHLGVDSRHLIRKVLDTDEADVIEKALEDFKSYWDQNISVQSRLFDGVLETLEVLKGKKMLVLSNGIARVIQTMLDRFDLRKYFSGIYTGDEPDCVKPAACPIEKALKEASFQEKSRVMMVGDMAIDVEAGKRAGIRTCAVTYGMGRIQDIKRSRPDFILSDFRRLQHLVR